MNQRFSLRLFLNLVCLICVATLCACNQAASSSGGGAEVAAKVNSVIIPLSKVDRQIEQELKQQTSQSLSELSPIALASLRMMALDRLITQEVLLQRAQKESIQVSDDDVKQRVQELIQAQGWSQEEYQKTIKELGMTEEEFRNEQRKLLLINKLVDRLKTRIPAPSEKEIADFYNQNPEQFKLGKGVYLSQIVVSPTNDGLKNDAVTEEQAKQKIATIAAQLKAGDDFATVA
ncbi:MAG TPA: peptidylprolyl isomerase, partial [Acidobacteriota bacterium]|nr:peptidylprolyl isomerase [Acidobacteriota bacterium]